MFIAAAPSCALLARGTLATLTLVNGTTTHAFDFVGDYSQGDFKITSGATSTITHT
jgi:hypothetical protein